MADEAVNFEPDSKRPRIALESSQSNLHTETNDQACEEITYELPKCVQGKDTDEKERKDSTGPDHVRDESSKARNIRNEDNPGNDASVNESSKSGLEAVIDTCVSEKDVGILEFVSNFPGFHGVLKQRYTDFIVGERDLQGNIVRLSDTSIPQGEKTKEFALDILSLEEKEKIQKVVDDEEKNLSVTLSPDGDKDHRRLVHRAIRENYSFLDSDTVDVGDKKAVRVFHKRDSSGKQRNTRWPAELGNYCWFVLYKENKDTMDAINLLSKLLKIKAGMFGYAGTKDRRAVTTQQVSVYRVRAEQLQDLNATLRNICVGNFKYYREPLKLGSLSGNHFIITLRNVVGDHEKIAMSLESLKLNGFINYFGLQRFGTTSVPTHKIGRALLLSNWSEAIDLLLGPRNGEPDDLTAARQYWKDTKDAKGALKRMPKRNCIESDLLQGLVRHGPSGLINALQALSRNTRLLYVHAYQSYVWNSMASRRIKEYGLQPIKGDLVVESKSSADCSADTDESQMQDTIEFISEPSRTAVTVVTEEHLKSGQFTIHDVVLPLPGYDVVYPENQLKDHYRQVMTNDGLDIDNMKRKVRDYSLSGAYRIQCVMSDNGTDSRGKPCPGGTGGKTGYLKNNKNEDRTSSTSKPTEKPTKSRGSKQTVAGTANSQISSQTSSRTTKRIRSTVYTYWGSSRCPTVKDEVINVVYSGRVASLHSRSNPAVGSDYMCVPDRFEYTDNKNVTSGLHLSPVKYGPNMTIFTAIGPEKCKQWGEVCERLKKNKPSMFRVLDYHQVPCAVCRHEKYSSTLVTPGRNMCHPGMWREYYGYLMTGQHGNSRSQHICVGADAVGIPGSNSTRSQGPFLQHVTYKCDDPSCPQNLDSLNDKAKAVTCVVCSF